MLFLNVSRAFKLRGVENPARHLLKLGISRPTISRLMNNDKSWVSYGHLEKICSVLNCTPNDLFEWKPSGDSNLPENHALYTLRRDASARSLKEMVKDIPLERMSEVEDLLKLMENSSENTKTQDRLRGCQIFCVIEFSDSPAIGSRPSKMIAI